MSMDDLSLGIAHTQDSRSMSFNDQELTQMAKEILNDLHGTDPVHHLWGNPRITKLPSFHSFALSPTAPSSVQSPMSHDKTSSAPSFNSELIHNISNLKCATPSTSLSPHEPYDSWRLLIPDIPIISTSKSSPVPRAHIAPRPLHKSKRNKVCKIPDFMDKAEAKVDSNESKDAMQKIIKPNEKQLHGKSHNDLHGYKRRSVPGPKRHKRRRPPPPMTKRHRQIRQSVPANSSRMKKLKHRQKQRSLPDTKGDAYKSLKNRYHRHLPPPISVMNKDMSPASQSHSNLRANVYRQQHMETRTRKSRSVPPCNSPLVEEYMVEGDNAEFVFVSSMLCDVLD
eukprot:85387_1